MTPLGEVQRRLAGGATKVECAGLAGSSKAYLVSRLLETEGKKGVVYLAPTTKEASAVLRDLKFFGMDTEFFPPHDALPFTGLSPHLDISCQRMAVLAWLVIQGSQGGVPHEGSTSHRFPGTASKMIVTTPAAISTYLPPPELFDSVVTLRAGEELGRDLLITQLTQWGYEKVTLVTDRGTFAVRGSLVDLFPPGAPRPLRVEWLGDLVETIRPFDPSDQRSQGVLKELCLFPAREVVLTEGTIRNFQEKVRRLAEERDLPKNLWGPLVEKVKSGIFFSGIETYLLLFYESPATFWDYFKGGLLVSDDPLALKKSGEEHRGEITLIASARPQLVRSEEVIRASAGIPQDDNCYRHCEILPLGRGDAVGFDVETHEKIRQEIDRQGLEPLAPIAHRIKGWLETDQVTLVASSDLQRGRLRDLFQRYFTPFPFEIVVGELTTGFRLPSERITYLTDEEIFGPRIRRPTQEHRGGLSSLAEIQPGDPLVHKQHGIGAYRGMIHMTIEGIENDFLLLEYRGGDKLYLPVYRLNLVDRYSGAEGTPRLDRLGGTSWLKIRQKAEKAIRELAGDLLNLYAARSACQGFAFSPGNEMFETFEAGFPFEETPDQGRAITETLADMQRDRPMDRLVLGDVGYGKTEVAMRAAFKATLDSKQVAVLVPTTLLAFQHFERFSERFRSLPVTIEMISRFRSPSEQKKILRELAAGRVDVIIGTHRLLQPDVSYKDLGLLVIDEEHRFGVSHKEKIKRLKRNVDVLALSATPIPRTLYMSLVGLRGVSVIETPPTDRLAIRTYVMPFQDAVIREAILREIHRGGQVFFVHNQIETIPRMRDFLRKLVPEATVEIAHGQMEEEELEQVMLRFYHQEFQVLLCTTIIESGIDIPTANTILIHEADRFGLAQVYQLRGRVGRGSHRAFAYLLVKEEKELTPEAVKRLQVLQRFSELGSGFQLASYDLEIRGAGNLLGREQSGQMAAIGYELYTELLEKAVAELKGQPTADEIDPELHLKVPAFLPEDYIPDPPLRLEFYRRLASLATEDDAEPVEDEMRDRFGKPPPEAEQLLELSVIKCLAKRLRIKQIRYDGRTFAFHFDPTSPLPPEILTQKMTREPKRFRMTPDLKFLIHQAVSPPLQLEETKRFLRELSLHLPH